ncbi:MAG: glycosyltransferase [Microbacterium sp.]
MLEAGPPWDYVVVLPRKDPDEEDLFGPALTGSRVRRLGPRQPAGASKPGSLARSATLGIRLLALSAVLRWHGALRKADLVHANSTRSAIYGALALAGSRKPFVVHLRDMITPESLGPLGFRLFTSIALRRADGVIANSAATLASARPYTRDATATTVLPSAAGISTVRSAPAPRPTVRKVGMLARIDHWKGQDLLLKAFARSALSEQARLVFAGGAPFGMESYLAELTSLADRLGIADTVDFRGHVDDAAGFIDEMDVCVQCSTRAEPLGQNILQYLSRGAVVIAADEGGPREWINDGRNGLLVTPRDPDALAAALSRVGADARLRASLARGAAATPGLRDDRDVAQEHAAFFRLVHARKRGG